MTAGFIFYQNQVPPPFLCTGAKLPLPTTVSEQDIFFFYEFVVFVLCEVAEVIARFVPPPTPLNFVKSYFHFSTAAEQISFVVYIYQLHRMLFPGKQIIKRFFTLWHFNAGITGKGTVSNTGIVYAETATWFKYFGKQVCSKHARRSFV